MTHPHITEWRVHLGAHKAASTHLAKSLLARSEEQARHGVTYVSNTTVIRPLLRNADRRNLPEKVLTHILPSTARLYMATRGRAIRQGIAKRVALPGAALFSEENLLGPLSSCLTGRVYPDLSRLHLLRHVIGPDRAELFLAIRSFDSYLPSVYAQQLRLTRINRRTLNRAVASFVERPPRWIDLIRRIRAILPEARLQVWDHADYRANDWRIADGVSGVALGPRESIAVPTGTASPSAQAIAAAEALDMLTGPERSKRVREMFARDIESGEEKERFDPLPSETKTILREAFRRDLDAIDREFPGMLMNFAS